VTVKCKRVFGEDAQRNSACAVAADSLGCGDVVERDAAEVDVSATQPLLQKRERYAGDNGGYEPHGEPSAERAQVQTTLRCLTPGVRVSNPDNHSSSTAGSTIARTAGGPDWGAVQVDGIVMTNTGGPRM